MEKGNFNLISREKIVSNQPHFDVLSDKFSVNNKEGKYVFIDHPGSVIIIPVTEENKILLINQYRYVTKRDSLELVAGGCESEDFKNEVIREMEEEVGFIASPEDLKFIGSFYPSNGYSNELMKVFVVRNLKKTKINRNEMEFIDKVSEFEIKDVYDLVFSNKINDGPTLAALLLLQKEL